jgi:hypothetical protein
MFFTTIKFTGLGVGKVGHTYRKKKSVIGFPLFQPDIGPVSHAFEVDLLDLLVGHLPRFF